MEANPRSDQMYASLQESVSRLAALTEKLRADTPEIDEPERFMRLAGIIEGMKGGVVEGAFAPMIASLLLRLTDPSEDALSDLEKHYNFPQGACSSILPHAPHDWLSKSPREGYGQWYECLGVG